MPKRCKLIEVRMREEPSNQMSGRVQDKNQIQETMIKND